MALADGPSFPYLYVNVLVISDTNPVAYNVRVSFRQRASLLANGQEATVATWTKSAMGKMSSRNRARDAVRDDIRGFVDIFSNDYLTVNPQP